MLGLTCCSGIKSFTNIDPCLWQGQPLGFYVLSLPIEASFKDGCCLSCKPSKKCELTVIGHIATHAGMLSDF